MNRADWNSWNEVHAEPFPHYNHTMSILAFEKQPKPKRARVSALSPPHFRRALAAWFRVNARVLPWRGDENPYHIWVSEIMLQQTRVAAVIEHYKAFLHRFPTLVSVALAPEQDVLAAWSGLGYYRRARMLHKAAQFVVEEYGGAIPDNAAELRKLPGVGDYTAAAIASIAFGESVPVLDGNVERVLLRVFGQPEDKSKTARADLMVKAAALITAKGCRQAPGDHNQAMMELGATVCLPRNPLCQKCPVRQFCITQGEHLAPPRAKLRSQEVAYLLATRKVGTATEVLLCRRAQTASLMAGMWELPEACLESVAGEPALLSLRHSITNTNYYVCVYSMRSHDGPGSPGLRSSESLHDGQNGKRSPGHLKGVWTRTSALNTLPLTGLARKVLQRLELMALPTPSLPAKELEMEAETVM